MTKALAVTVLASTLLFLGTGMPAHADTVVFDFNPLATNSGAGSIQGYMNSLLPSGASVVVSSGAITDRTYNGDGHVTGPNGSSLTLGTSDGATNGTTPTPTGALNTVYDTFVRNRSGYTSFTLTFSGFPIYGVSFDYEIFPDGTCANGDVLGRCNSNWPDLKFEAGNGSTSQIFQYFGVMPGDATSTPGVKWSETPGWWSYSNSPAPGSTELAPQLLGTWDGYFASPVTTLTFRDWPATIGIDNLVIHTPEPSSVVLLGTFLLVSLGALRRKFRA